MTIALLWIGFTIGFIAGCAWANAMRRPPNAPRDWTYELVDDGAIYVGLDGLPKLERAYDIATVAPQTIRIIGATTIALTANTKPEARN